MNVIERNLQEDQEDYERFLIEYGFTHETVAAVVQNQADLVPMPEGFDKVVLLDSPLQGKGLFATRQIQAGELIAPARIDRKRTPAGRFTNHATRPNARFVRLQSAPDSDMDMMATRRIEKGEEVLMDYRQAGSANGNNMWPDMNEAKETIRLRFSKCTQELAITPLELENCITGVLLTLRYLPSDFFSLVVSGRVSQIAAEIGYLRAGLYLGSRQWKAGN